MSKRKIRSDQEVVSSIAAKTAGDFSIGDLWAELGAAIVEPMRIGDITAKMYSERFGISDSGAIKRMKKFAKNHDGWEFMDALLDTNHVCKVLRKTG